MRRHIEARPHAGCVMKVAHKWCGRTLRIARELASALQQNGVRAGMVQNARDLVDPDPQIAAREAFVSINHPAMGPVVYNAAPYKLSATPPLIRSAPELGQHNDEVFREWLGLPDEEIERLEKLEAFV